jgi:hypothetical protein
MILSACIRDTGPIVEHDKECVRVELSKAECGDNVVVIVGIPEEKNDIQNCE